MSTAAERAEARRKAILAKRGDRLAKLTTSARGDESTFLNDDVSSVSSFSRSFLGEEPSADMSAPPRPSVSPSPRPTLSKSAVASPKAPSPISSSATPETLFGVMDETVWSPEKQAQFRAALLSANPIHSNNGSRVSSGAASNSGTSTGLQINSNPAGNTGDNDPLAEIMATLGGGVPGQSPGSEMFELFQKMRQGVQPPSPASEVPKRDKAIWRFVQLISTWLLLAYFVFFLEPAAYRERVGTLDVGRWSRWAVLGESINMLELLSTFKVQPQAAFFWAFITLEVAVHFNTVRTFLSPPSNESHLNSIGRVSKLLGLFNIILLFLKDLGSIVFGLGIVILLASYAAPKK